MHLYTRLKRGAVRAAMLAQHKLEQHRFRAPLNVWQPVRTLLLNALVVRVVLIPVPLVAPATAVAAGPDEGDPSPRVVRVSLAAQEALQLTRTEDPTLVIAQSALQAVAIGQSNADVRAAEAVARAEAERQAAEAAKVAAAAKAKADAAVAAAKAQAVSTRSVASFGTGEVQTIIVNAAAKYNVDASLMLRIAKCESGFRPDAKNRHSAASGLFQFMPSTFRNSPQARAGMSIWDPVANAEAAAYKIANGGLRAWNASKHCWNR